MLRNSASSVCTLLFIYTIKFSLKIVKVVNFDNIEYLNLTTQHVQ